jgi:tetratricopeptide (TPR) repeat protein
MYGHYAILIHLNLQIFWAARDLVTTTSDTELPRLAVASLSDEWERSGRSLFSKKRYAHAMQCFQRASLRREAAVAEAYLLRDQARAVSLGQHNNGDMRSKAFIDAAEAFVRCALSASVEKRAYYRTAAVCFKESDKLSEATQNYLNAEDFDSAAKVFCDAQKFDDAVRVVRDHQDTMQSNVVLQVVSVCARHYFETGQSRQVSQNFPISFGLLVFTAKAEICFRRMKMH